MWEWYSEGELIIGRNNEIDTDFLLVLVINKMSLFG
jgi:hypothetical protein